MYPNQPGQSPYGPQQPTGIDYLNQIAPQNSGGNGFSKKQIFLFGGLIVAMLIVFVAMLAGGGGSQSTAARGLELHARLASTQTIVTEAQPNIRSSALASFNASLRLYLTNTRTSLSTPLGIVSSELSEEQIALVPQTELKENLENGQYAGTFDRVYAIEMQASLTQLAVLMDQIYQKTEGTDAGKALEDAYSSLEPLRKQLEEISATLG